MRMVRTIVILSIVLVIGFYFINYNEPEVEEALKYEAIEKTSILKEKVLPKDISHQGEQRELSNWIGKSDEELIDVFGEPERYDLSAYDYQWWIYKDGLESYIQFGIEDHSIKTIFATGNFGGFDTVSIGESYDTLNMEFKFKEEVEYIDGPSSFNFRMTDEDIERRPLVKMTDDLFMQLYFDTFTNELSSIRLIKAEVLLRHKPYEIVYRGNLPPEPNLTDEEWNQVQVGMEQQIFDISNVLRNRYNKSEFEWEQAVSEVAFHHSKDMYDNDYFSHYSENGDGLKERLDVTGLFYLAAGENIAAQYPDAPAAIEGWLNSEGHREALLTDEYTHLGVGVYRLYYTQNFLAKPL